MILVFGAVAIVGQLLFAFGVMGQSWSMMHLGRFLLGVGGDTLKISNYALLPEWFSPVDLGLANGIVSLSRLGSMLTFVISPNLIARFSFSTTLSPNFILAFLAVIGLVALQYFQYRVTQQIANNEIQSYELVSNPVVRQNSGDREERGEANAGGAQGENDEGDEDDDDEDEEDTSISEIDTILNSINDEETDDERNGGKKNKNNRHHQNARSRNTLRSSNSRDTIGGSSTSSTRSKSTSSSSSAAFSWSNIGKLELKFWMLALSYCLIVISFGPFQNISFTILLERDYFKPIPSSCTLTRTNACQGENNPPLATCPTDTNYQLPLPASYASYNPLTAANVDCTNSVWNEGCTEAYCHRLNHAESYTAFIIAIQFFVYLFTAGPFQRVADDAMARLAWLGNAVVILFLTHLFIATTSAPAWLIMVGQGLATTTFNLTFWSLLGFTVDRKIYGTAFGVLQSLQHIVYAVMPLILAQLYNSSGQRYLPQVEYVFVVASLLALLPLSALYLFRNALNMQL